MINKDGGDRGGHSSYEGGHRAHIVSVSKNEQTQKAL